ncbi:MAG: phage protein Gp36 family protein [Methylobacter sp.]
MDYCTEQNLVDRSSELELVQLTNRDDATATTINTAVLNKAIAAAAARINRYITQYLPLTAVPEDFEQMACDITLYFLYHPLVPEHIQTVYDDAIKYLEKVASGKIPIAPDATGSVAEPSDATVSFSSSPSAFSRGNY